MSVKLFPFTRLIGVSVVNDRQKTDRHLDQLFRAMRQFAAEALAIHHEHRVRNFGAARELALFALEEASGSGPVLVNAFGAIETYELDGEVIVDTGHLVAFGAGIEYEVTKASRGWIASYLSGEGLVLRMSGRGRILPRTGDRSSR